MMGRVKMFPGAHISQIRESNRLGRSRTERFFAAKSLKNSCSVCCSARGEWPEGVQRYYGRN